MSDILLHSAVLDNTEAVKAYVNQTLNPGAPYNAASYQDNTALIGYPLKQLSAAGKDWCSVPISSCPPIVTQWEKYLKPVLKSYTCGFKVCDTSGYYRCGSSCVWTVPAGVCCVQFQLWGPGSGNSAQCCCGGAPFGVTGAYMLVQMQVTPGSTYTLSAGCAYCCYASQTVPGICGSSTSITGTGLSVCAESGMSDVAVWNTTTGSNSNTPSLMLPSRDTCASNSCSGWNFCWDTAADDTWVPHAYGTKTWYSLCSDTSKNQVYYGIPSIFPAHTVGNCFLGCSNNYTISGPVFGFETSTCCFSYNCGSLSGSNYGGCFWSAQNGYQQIPAVGGYGLMQCAGYDASTTGGDSGGMGMICVSYICS